MFHRSFWLAAVGILTVATAARASDFVIDCTFFRGTPNGKPERTANPSKVTKSGEEGGFSDTRQIETGGRVVAVGREVCVSALSRNDGHIQVEARLGLAEMIGPNNRPVRCESWVKTSAVIRPGGKVTVEVVSETKEKHWVEITVRHAK